MALTDWELWACAAAMERQHGSDAQRAIAERIGALAAAGDSGGVEAWREIARRFAELRQRGPDLN